MSNDTQAYDLAVVRDLLLAAFTADDLRRVILYTSLPALKPLIHQFSAGDGLAAMVEKTTTFCHKQDCIDDLLTEVKTANSRQFSRFESRLLAGGAAPADSSSGTGNSMQGSRSVTYVTNIERGYGIAIGDGARVSPSKGESNDDSAGRNPGK